MDALKQISNSSLKSEAPVINVGDTVKVPVMIMRSLNREKKQKFWQSVVSNL